MTGAVPSGSQPNPPEQESETSLDWRTLVRHVLVVAIAGIVLYLVAPELASVFSAWPRLSTLQYPWLAVALAAEGAHFGCTFALQRLALRTRAWTPVILAQLTGNAVTLVLPGGAAAGAAVQYRLLSAAGISTSDAVGGLTAFTFLGIGGLLGLPVVALLVVALGAPVAGDLVDAGIISAGAFAAFAAVSTIALTTDAPLAWIGRVVTSALRSIRRRHAPPTELGRAIIGQRNQIRSVLGTHWKQAVTFSTGRLALDLFCLYASLRAVGEDLNPAVVLLVFSVAGVIGLVPITPGGLGVVEASLTALLALSGVPTGRAILATLTYRLASYWIPITTGPVAYALSRRIKPSQKHA